jgi:hypothetical protein
MFTDAASQPQPLWLVLVSSSVLSAAISAGIAGLINLRAGRADYVNDYYKTVLKRRLAAYEQLERLIMNLKVSVVDPPDQRPYHLIFTNDPNGENSPHVVLFGVMSQGLWLSNEVFEESRKLDIVMFGLKQGDEIPFGRRNYEAIATIRQELERLMAKDMLNLHDVKGFLQSKDKPDPGFSPIMLQR